MRVLRVPFGRPIHLEAGIHFLALADNLGHAGHHFTPFAYPIGIYVTFGLAANENPAFTAPCDACEQVYYDVGLRLFAR